MSGSSSSTAARGVPCVFGNSKFFEAQLEKFMKNHTGSGLEANIKRRVRGHCVQAFTNACPRNSGGVSESLCKIGITMSDKGLQKNVAYVHCIFLNGQAFPLTVSDKISPPKSEITRLAQELIGELALQNKA